MVEAQTLFAADAPQHAPAQRQWRRAAEIKGEALANGQTGGRGAAEAQMPRERGEGDAAGASAGARDAGLRGADVCACVCGQDRARGGTLPGGSHVDALSAVVIQNLGSSFCRELPPPPLDKVSNRAAMIAFCDMALM